jgi:serine/threonine-protein kinase
MTPTAAETEVLAAAPAPAPPAKKNSVAIASIAVVVILLGLAGYFAWWFVAGGAQKPTVPRPEAERPVENVTPTPPPPPALPPLPEGMVLVPGGSYVIGRNGQDPLESPEHIVEVAPFYMDRTEVTNAQYKAFVDATGHEPPLDWVVDGTFTPGRENWPVINVKWQDAVDYATWAGKRLPSEDEWEAAARGKDGRIYPWGNEWTPGLANIAAKSITDVGQHKDGAAPSGVFDMIGNVWEWTADEFALYPGSKAKPPEVESGVTYRVIRGGAFDGNKKHDAAYRGYVDAAEGYPKTGFRCVKSAPVGAQ